MDDSYFEASPIYLGRGVKLLVFLTLLRVKNATLWAAFLSLNPGIRTWLQKYLRARQKDPVTVDRRIRKLANLVSAAFLYMATCTNSRVPKDYISLFLGETYYGKLVPPTSPVVVSPTTATYFRLSSYREGGLVRTLYRNKHYVVFPMICGQILSNYLTPTRYKLNQRYFSPLLKVRLLDPIWKNFRLGIRVRAIHWPGLCFSYAKHNGLLFLYVAALNVRTGLWTRYYKSSSEGGFSNPLLKNILIQFLTYCGHRANSLANIIYIPNLLAMGLLAITAPMLTQILVLKKWYMANQKQSIKLYMRTIGFIAGLSTMMIHSKSLVSGKEKMDKKEDIKNQNSCSEFPNTGNKSRNLGPDFYNSVSLYFTQLIILSKWRILKENHPWFTLLKVGTWQRMETGLMCYLVWKLMNLNDYVRRNTPVSGNQELERLQNSPWIRAINRIMN